MDSLSQPPFLLFAVFFPFLLKMSNNICFACFSTHVRDNEQACLTAFGRIGYKLLEKYVLLPASVIFRGAINDACGDSFSLRINLPASNMQGSKEKKEELLIILANMVGIGQYFKSTDRETLGVLRRCFAVRHRLFREAIDIYNDAIFEDVSAEDDSVDDPEFGDLVDRTLSSDDDRVCAAGLGLNRIMFLNRIGYNGIFGMANANNNQIRQFLRALLAIHGFSLKDLEKGRPVTRVKAFFNVIYGPTGLSNGTHFHLPSTLPPAMLAKVAVAIQFNPITRLLCRHSRQLEPSTALMRGMELLQDLVFTPGNTLTIKINRDDVEPRYLSKMDLNRRGGRLNLTCYVFVDKTGTEQKSLNELKSGEGQAMRTWVFKQGKPLVQIGDIFSDDFRHGKKLLDMSILGALMPYVAHMPDMPRNRQVSFHYFNSKISRGAVFHGLVGKRHEIETVRRSIGCLRNQYGFGDVPLRIARDGTRLELESNDDDDDNNNNNNNNDDDDDDDDVVVEDDDDVNHFLEDEDDVGDNDHAGGRAAGGVVGNIVID